MAKGRRVRVNVPEKRFQVTTEAQCGQNHVRVDVSAGF
jgi:hypothetical protein